MKITQAAQILSHEKAIKKLFKSHPDEVYTFDEIRQFIKKLNMNISENTLRWFLHSKCEKVNVNHTNFFGCTEALESFRKQSI